MILALLSLDRDPANPVNGFANAVTNVVCALDLYRVDGGNGYAHSKGGAANAMATEQALRALTTYRVSSGETIAWKSPVTAGKGSSSKDPQKPTVAPGVLTPGAGSDGGAGNGTAGFAGVMAPVAAKMAGASSSEGAKAAGDSKAEAESGKKDSTESSVAGKTDKSGKKSGTSGKTATLSAGVANKAADAGSNGFAIAGVAVGIVGIAAVGGWFFYTKRRAA